MGSQRLIISKGTRILRIFIEDILVKSLPIALGFEPVGSKKTKGDGRSPEGQLFIRLQLFYSGFGVPLTP